MFNRSCGNRMLSNDQACYGTSNKVSLPITVANCREGFSEASHNGLSFCQVKLQMQVLYGTLSTSE